MASVSPIFHRRPLADRLATQVLATPAGSASSSGLFLAAPRRTGKSTFMREDLRPALESRGAIVVYCGLWENRKANPGEVIVAAIRAELARRNGVQVGGLSLPPDRIGLGREVPLTQALVALSDVTRKLTVLIIDEAQHAITPEGGSDALFALKAARDELNSSRHHGLRVVAIGANRDKLAMLRNSKDQAFSGAPLVRFPELGPDFVEWFCQQAQLGFDLDPPAVMELFVQAAYRPEVLGAAADALRFDFQLDPLDGPRRFAEEVRLQIESTNAGMLRIVHSLPPLQSAVLRIMAGTGEDYAPFEAATLERYRQALSRSGNPAVNADVPAVQQALIALQDKGLAWKAARGVYALEETGLADLLAQAGLLEGLPQP